MSHDEPPQSQPDESPGRSGFTEEELEWMLDRSKGWDPFASRTISEPNEYSHTADGSVYYLPITRDQKILGYLWASPDDDAASFVRDHSAGRDGFNAGTPWVRRLREAKTEGLNPLQAIRKWKGEPEDSRAGAIPADVEEQEASSLAALKELAKEPDQ